MTINQFREKRYQKKIFFNWTLLSFKLQRFNVEAESIFFCWTYTRIVFHQWITYNWTLSVLWSDTVQCAIYARCAYPLSITLTCILRIKTTYVWHAAIIDPITKPNIRRAIEYWWKQLFAGNKYTNIFFFF